MKYTIQDLQKEFPNDDACLEDIFRTRFPHKKDYHRIPGRKAFVNKQGHQIYPLKGTIFEKSRTPLTLWYYAIFLFFNSKNGVSGAELSRQLGVTYKCAWRMGNQIRKAMKTQSLLKGVVEVDETYVGGRKKKHPYGGRGTKKQPVMGLVSREGKACLKVIPNVSGRTLTTLTVDNVKKGSTVITDDWKGYVYIRDWFDHYIINHSEWQYGYSLGDFKVNTNRVEGIWNHVKSTIRGTYMGVSRKYLQSYLDQVAWSYNHPVRDRKTFHSLLRKGLSSSESL